MKFAGRRAPLCVDVLDDGCRRTGAHGVEQTLQIIAQPFGDKPDRAVGMILHIAGQPDFGRAPLDEPPKTDALDHTGNSTTETSHLFS